MKDINVSEHIFTWGFLFWCLPFQYNEQPLENKVIVDEVKYWYREMEVVVQVEIGDWPINNFNMTFLLIKWITFEFKIAHKWFNGAMNFHVISQILIVCELALANMASVQGLKWEQEIVIYLWLEMFSHAKISRAILSIAQHYLVTPSVTQC